MSKCFCDSLQFTEEFFGKTLRDPIHHASLRFGIGGALTTCFSSFANLRYPGGFLGRSFTSALPFGSDITQPPDRSEHPKLGVCQRLTRALAQNAACRLVGAH